MSMSSIPSSSPGGKRYGWVEKIGNKVPHPFLLFIYLIAVLIAATAILSALNDQELEMGLRSLAVPLFNAQGQVQAALNVGVHAGQMTAREMIERVLPELQKAARELTLLLR
ncbi:Pca regulon regulatory protein PcaR [Klebsiella pneumoniae]|nr:Pca regulon regulatory protein PcaR [Klebsiella pneumoniae]